MIEKGVIVAGREVNIMKSIREFNRMTKSIFIVSVDQLRFDPENPRLPVDVGNDQQSIFRYLVDEIGVRDLLDSMSTTGFIDADPIIVSVIARANGEKNIYNVIEGNRRLAALKLLTGETIGDGQLEPSVPNVTDEIRQRLSDIPVESDWANEELEAYLGYKHVTSSKEWGPEAKARFVLTRAKGNLSNDNLRQYAKQFGTSLAALKRWVAASLVLKQAEEFQVFDPKKAFRKRYFGTFYTFLSSSVIQNYLGLSLDNIEGERLVKEDKMPRLENLLSWTIGTEDSPPFINSRDQTKLEEVLQSPNALNFLIEKRNLNAALLYTEFNAGQVAANLKSASYTIDLSLSMLFDTASHSGVQEAFEMLTRSYQKAVLNYEAGIKKKNEG